MRDSRFRLLSRPGTVSASILLGLSALGPGSMGCGHARAVGDDSPTTHGTPPSDARPPAKTARTRAPVDVSPVAPSKAAGRPDAPPLATSPAGLLKPNAIEAIQGELKSRGHLPMDHHPGSLDGPTRQGLQAFQKENNLPATGMPDDLTVQKLGLKVEQIFRAASPP